MLNLGKLKEIKDLRKVWQHEALNFTPWFAEDNNLALLADAIGLEITIDETESGVIRRWRFQCRHLCNRNRNGQRYNHQESACSRGVYF